MSANGQWALDIENSSEEEARLAAQLLSAHGIAATPVDPIRWLTWHLDRASVEALVVGLRAGLATASTSEEVAAAIESLLEDCEAWVSGMTQPRDGEDERRGDG